MYYITNDLKYLHVYKIILQALLDKGIGMFQIFNGLGMNISLIFKFKNTTYNLLTTFITL